MPEEGTGEESAIGPPPIPLVTRTERGGWVVYGLVAVLLVVVPLTTHSFSLPDVAAVALLLGAVLMSWRWFRNGHLRQPEWLAEADYEEFLKELHRPFEPDPGSDSD